MATKLSTLTRFLLIFIVLFVILRLPSLFEPYWYGDEGIYLVLGAAIRKGITLYSQIHDNKPPSLYYLAAFAQTVFGFRLLLAVFMAGAYYYFYKLADKLVAHHLARSASLIFLVLTSIPLFEGNIANAEVFMLLPTIAGMYYLLTAKNNPRLFVIGLLLGLAFSIKIPVFIELVFISLWILITRFQLRHVKSLIFNYFWLFLGFILPFVVYMAYYGYQGALNDYFFAALLQNFGYLSSWTTGSHSGSAASGGLVTRAVALLAFWALVFWFYHKEFLDKKVAFIIFWFSATIFGALLSTRPYPHYLIQVLPPFSLLLCLSFSRATKNSVRYFIILNIIALVAIFFKYKFYVYPVFSYYQNYYSHIFNTSSPDYRNFFGNYVNDTYLIADYLKANTDPSKKIFIWGDEPYIYALADRLPVGKYTVAYHIADFRQHDQTLAKLISYLPDTVLYFAQENRPFPALDDFLSRYYAPVNVIGRGIIYSRLP